MLDEDLCPTHESVAISDGIEKIARIEVVLLVYLERHNLVAACEISHCHGVGSHSQQRWSALGSPLARRIDRAMIQHGDCDWRKRGQSGLQDCAEAFGEPVADGKSRIREPDRQILC